MHFSIIVIVGWIHMIVGLAVVLDPGALLVSSLAGLSRLAPVPTESAQVFGVALFIFGLLAYVSTKVSATLVAKFCMIMPQQLVLCVQVVSITSTIMLGIYPDGYAPKGACLVFEAGSCFILADQAAWLILGILHTIKLFKVILWPRDYIENARTHLPLTNL